LTKSLAAEFAARNVTVNAVAPGFIETKMTEVLPEDVRQKYLDAIPARRLGQPQEVASLISFLASDSAGYINGQVINVSTWPSYLFFNSCRNWLCHSSLLEGVYF